MTQSRIPSPARTHRPYYDPAYLLKIYHWIRVYKLDHGFAPTHREFVEAGLAASTSVIRYYLDRMGAMGLIQMYTFERAGKKYTPARGIQLLPLAKADPIIKNLIKKETRNEQPEN